jgi:hypothetical protein
VLFGGTDAAGRHLFDTWELDGDAWVQRGAGGPLGGAGGSFASDASRAFPLLFGHGVFELLPPPVATWALHGRGCPGSAGTPLLDDPPNARPALGTTFPLQLTALPAQPGAVLLALGFGFARWNGFALPLGLDPMGLPGCELWVEPAVGLIVAHPGTAASFPFSIPNAAGLAGVLVSVQALSFDAAAPSGFGAASNAGVMRMY